MRRLLLLALVVSACASPSEPETPKPSFEQGRCPAGFTEHQGVGGAYTCTPN